MSKSIATGPLKIDLDFPSRMILGAKNQKISVCVTDDNSFNRSSQSSSVLSNTRDQIIGRIFYPLSISDPRIVSIELIAPMFQISEGALQTKIVNLNHPTSWKWTLVAPDVVGVYEFTVNVYKGKKTTYQSTYSRSQKTTANPEWIGKGQIEVIQSTSVFPSFSNNPENLSVVGIGGAIIAILLSLINFFLSSKKEVNQPLAKRVENSGLQNFPWEPPYLGDSEKQPTVRSFNLKNIRTLLIDGFTDEELRQFCYDTPDFRPVYDQLAQISGKTLIIRQLIEYADLKGLLEVILAWAKENNPTKYERHQPYME